MSTEVGRLAASHPLRRSAVVGVLLVVACNPTAMNPSPSTSVSGRPSTAPTDMSASPSSTPASPQPPSGAPVGASGWREVGSFGAANVIEQVVGVAFGADLFVAVGNRYPGSIVADEGGPSDEGLVWLSPDGESWEPLQSQPTFDDAELTSVVAAQDGSLLAFGRTFGEAPGTHVWRSLSGRSWEPVDLGFPPDLAINSVVHGANGYLLHAYPQIWFSADGLVWDPVDEPRPFWGVAAGDEGFVAWLEAGSGDAAMTIASADGHSWFPGDALPGGGRVAPLGGDWISAIVPSVVPFPVELQIWFSANGLDWTRVAAIHDPEERDSFGYVGGLTSAGGRVFLTVALSICCGGPATPGGVWSSQDGTVWEPTDVNQDGFVAAAADHDGTVVLAGYVGVTGGRATFWVNQLP